jgi:hypothetical protein
MGHGPLSPSYSSGHDFSIEVEGVRFRFNAEDFHSRVGAAAVRLGLLRRDALTPQVLEDLVALTAHGTVSTPRSPFAAHLDRHHATLLGGGADLVHWLRRLVFRGAWVDQQVRDGVLVPEFDETLGFVFRSRATGERTADEPRPPDWRVVAYTETA